MSLFEKLSNQGQVTPMSARNPLEMVQEIKQNPVGTLRKAGYNIPDGMNNPQDLINYLMQTGQVKSQQLQRARQLMNIIRR